MTSRGKLHLITVCNCWSRKKCL